MENGKKTKEIDVIGITKKILKEKKLLGIFIGGATIIGIIVAFSLPKQYTAKVVLAPELSSGGLGMSASLSDMASNFGIDLGSKSSYDAIYPEIYPDIFASTDFIRTLFNVLIRQKKDNAPKTYYSHITQDMKVPFWDYPKIWLTEMFKPKADKKSGKEDNFKLSMNDYEICNAIRGSISCLVDKKTNVITINVNDQDPLTAAILADTLQRRLQEYISSYKTQKARNDFEYYKKLCSESKMQYDKAQRLYASYADANQDVLLESFKAKQDELENEMQLKYNIYTQMTAQLQNARAKVQESTPAFTVIEKPTMPYKASNAPRSMIVILFILLGLIADGLWILYIRDFVIKEKNKTEDNK